jgi:hypothetical protein
MQINPGQGEQIMELFIDSTATEQLAKLTAAYAVLAPKVTAIARLHSQYKQTLNERVKESHPEHLQRERALEVSLIRLADAADELHPLIQPLCVAYQDAIATLPELKKQYKYRLIKTVHNNVTCAIELYESAAAIYYTVELLGSGVYMSAIERTYRARLQADDARHYVVRFNKEQTFRAPYMNPKECWDYNCRSHGDSVHTGAVIDVFTEEEVSECGVYEDFMRRRGLTPYKQTD